MDDCLFPLPIPKNPSVCPFRKGLEPQNPTLFGWDWNPQNPIGSGGVRGFLGYGMVVSLTFARENQSDSTNGGMVLLDFQVVVFFCKGNKA